jgi:O-antigen/teichoic acid export membrane protein
MSTASLLLRNSSVLLAGTFAAKGLVLLSYLILTRKLGAEAFGLYSFLFAYLAFFELFPDAGLETLLVREGARGEVRLARKVGDAWILRALLALVSLPLAVAALPLSTQNTEASFFVLLGAIPWLTSNRRTSLRSLLDIPYRIRLRMGLPTLLNVLAEGAHVAILPAAIAAFGLAGAITAVGVAPLPFCLALAFFSARLLKPDLAFDPGALRALFRSALPLLGGLLLNFVLVRSDVLLLERLRGTLEVGIYSAPARLVETANFVPALLMTSVYPLLSASHPADPARITKLFTISLRFLAALLVPVIALEIAFARPLVFLLFGESFAGSAPVLPWLAASEILIFVDIVFTARLLATNHDRRNVQLIAAAAAFNVAANLVLIPAYGATGAAAATILAYAVRLGCAFFFADTRSVSKEAIFAITPALAAGALASLVTMLAGARGWAAAGLAVFAYAFLLVLLRGVRPEEVREIGKAVRGLRAA